MQEQATANRITPEMVLEAYKVTGMKPATGWYYAKDDKEEICGCAYGALAVVNGYKGSNILEYLKKGNLETNLQYRNGFYNGFDGAGFNKSYNREDMVESLPLYQAGYEDGLAVRKAVIEAGYQL